MIRILAMALAFAAGLGAMVVAGPAQAACDVTGGAVTTFKCDGTGVNILADEDSEITVDVTDMIIEGTDDSSGYITFHNGEGLLSWLVLREHLDRLPGLPWRLLCLRRSRHPAWAR